MSHMLHVQFGTSNTGTNALGQRPMQARAYAVRANQFILLKAPPAAGKSRALMFVALDKMLRQGLEKTIVCVPETSIGASFKSTRLSQFGFDADWEVEDRWNLCLNEALSEKAKVKAFGDFLTSDAKVLICTHATFRFGYDKVVQSKGPEVFDHIFLAIDEFHHVSASDDNRLGVIVRELLKRGKCHLMAMTGSYFRGDTDPVLRPEDEKRFEKVVYSYYEQLEGYRYLKALDVHYSFYKGNYINGIKDVLRADEKTIVHIPHRGSSEAFSDKQNEVGKILDVLGTHKGREEETGFDLIECSDGRILKVADLVDDGPERDKIKAALGRTILKPDGSRDDEKDRAKVDIIIALGMAKEGFDWIWCEHALTVGYRSSLTEIVQIIGRATRDAPGKSKARFTNLVAEPGVETQTVQDAVNDMLKAISGSLLMEQVLAPNFKFYRREDGDVRPPVSQSPTGEIFIGIRDLEEPPTPRAKQIIEQDLNDLTAAALQKVPKVVLAEGIVPEVATQQYLTEIIEHKYAGEGLQAPEVESIRQHLSAQMNLVTLVEDDAPSQPTPQAAPGNTHGALTHSKPKTESELEEQRKGAVKSLLDTIKQFINVRELDMELIDSVNVFKERFEVASKTMDSKLLLQVQSAMIAMRIEMSEAEARTLWPRIKAFTQQEGREPNPHASSPVEKRLAEAMAWLRREKAKRMAKG